MRRSAHLVLDDGTVYQGTPFGAEVSAVGEVVFTTSMTGYQEMLTDPSFAGQIVVPTYPLIGNYGINDEDFESSRIQVAGFVVRSWSDAPSHGLSRATLHDYLVSQGVPGLSGVDTRAITRRLRSRGVMMGALAVDTSPDEALERLRNTPGYGATDFVRQITTAQPYIWGERPEPLTGDGDRRIVVTDYGVKYSILRILRRKGYEPVAVPATLSAEEVLALNPRGIVLSPGPGDPALLDYVVTTAKALVGRAPIMGICLGHQVMARAFGGRTYKLKFGHRGANHPVMDLADNRVTMTTPEPRLRRRRGQPPRGDGGQPRQPERRYRRGPAAPLPTRDDHSVPLGGISRPRDNEYIFDRFLDMVEA